jgi:hypothetical protein
MTYVKAGLWGVVLTTLLVTGFDKAALAESDRVTGLSVSQTSGYVNIGNRSGGQVVSFGLQMLKWKRAGHKIRFSGRCASACTLYLALPSKNMCISPGASFHFHAPYGGNARGNKVAKSYMLRNYPDWVRAWLGRNGGLGPRLVAMHYSYASRFIRPCAVQTAQNE